MFPRGAPGVTLALTLALIPSLGSDDALAQGTAADAVDSISITGLTTDDVASTLPSGSERSVDLNIENCLDYFDTDPEFTIQWTFNEADIYDAAEYSIKLVRGSDPCGATLEQDATDECDTLRERTILGTIVNLTTSMREILQRSITQADDCLTSTNGGNFEIRLIFMEENTDTGGTTTTTPVTDSLLFDLDLSRPGSPQGVAVNGGETTIVVTWDEVSDAVGYKVWFTTTHGVLDAVQVPERDLLGVSSRDVSSGTQTERSIDVRGLGTYYAAVAAVDALGNSSLLSEVVSVTTAPTEDFWEGYQAAGGSEVGGCAITGAPRSAAPVALLGLACMLASSLGRRRS